MFASAFWFGFGLVSVSLAHNVKQQKYCLAIDKINLYGAKCKGKQITAASPSLMENEQSICSKAKFSADVKWCSPVPVNRATPVYVSREAYPEECLLACSKVGGCVTSLRGKSRSWTPESDDYLGAKSPLHKDLVGKHALGWASRKVLVW